MKDPQHPANDRKTQGYQKVQGAHNECIDDYNLYQIKHRDLCRPPLFPGSFSDDHLCDIAEEEAAPIFPDGKYLIFFDKTLLSLEVNIGKPLLNVK